MLYECCIEKTRYHLGMATTSYCGGFFFVIRLFDIYEIQQVRINFFAFVPL